MRRMTLAGGLALAVSSLTLIAVPVAGATTYNNDTPIIINGLGSANPYPSSITVSGRAGPITDVNVGLDGLSHTIPNDVRIALVAPSGQALLLQECVGDASDGTAAFLTFDDTAAAQLPDDGPVPTGTFRPTAHCIAVLAFPAPGPLTYADPGPQRGGTATFASTFNGQSAIGTWNLYVMDRGNPGDSGFIPGGWSLDVKPDVTPLPSKKKCKKKKGKTSAAAAKKKGCKKKRKK